MAKLRRVRRMRDEELDHEGTWAVSYGDMVTLLLSFFILFFSIDPYHSKTPPTNGSLNLSIVDQMKAGNSQGPVNGNGAFGTSSATGTGSSGANPIFEIVKKLDGTIVPMGKKLIIDFPGISFFKSGKIPLTTRGAELLRNFASTYQAHMNKYKLNVMAYADTKKIKANHHLKFSDNMELSALRGVSAVRVLQSAGVPLKLMKLSGFGEIELTIEQLSKVPTTNLSEKEKLGLARRVILIVEPEENL